MRVAIVGYGAVSAIHAQQLRLRSEVELTAICGPSLQKADAFAKEHGVQHAVIDLESALEGCDAVIIGSPSPLHYQQGKFALDRGIPSLIELPACTSLGEAELLATTARQKNTFAQCAHTSRYLEPYRRLTPWIRNGLLGDIQQIHYFRGTPPRKRSWIDNPLLHHAAHPLDLLLHWFESIRPCQCATIPPDSPRDTVLLGCLPTGGMATIAISYTAKISMVRMIIVGSKHTVATDGFSFLESDVPDFRW